MEVVSGDIAVSGADDPLSLSETDGVLRRFSVLAGFDLYENKDIPIPGDNVDFPALRSITRPDDAITKGAKVGNRQNFGALAEWQQTMKEQGQRHETITR